jgi:hypothetical protein
MDWQLVQCTCKRVAFYPNSSCDLLEIHELLRSNAGVEIVYTPERRKPMDEKIIATYVYVTICWRQCTSVQTHSVR